MIRSGSRGDYRGLPPPGGQLNLIPIQETDGPQPPFNLISNINNGGSGAGSSQLQPELAAGYDPALGQELSLEQFEAMFTGETEKARKLKKEIDKDYRDRKRINHEATDVVSMSKDEWWEEICINGREAFDKFWQGNQNYTNELISIAEISAANIQE